MCRSVGLNLKIWSLCHKIPLWLVSNRSFPSSMTWYLVCFNIVYFIIIIIYNYIYGNGKSGIHSLYFSYEIVYLIITERDAYNSMILLYFFLQMNIKQLKYITKQFGHSKGNARLAYWALIYPDHSLVTIFVFVSKYLVTLILLSVT